MAFQLLVLHSVDGRNPATCWLVDMQNIIDRGSTILQAWFLPSTYEECWYFVFWPSPTGLRRFFWLFRIFLLRHGAGKPVKVATKTGIPMENSFMFWWKVKLHLPWNGYIYIYIVLGRQFTREKTKSSPSPRNHMPNSLWYMWVYVYKSVPKIKPLSHKSGWISVHCQPKLERISSSCLPKKNAQTSNQMRAWSRWSLCVLFILSSWKKSSGTRLWDSQLFMLEQ